MVRVGSGPQATAAALLLLLGAGIALAKPPDLPLEEEDTVGTPPVAAAVPPAVPATWQPLPASFYHLSVSARRALTASLLFGAHPLLVLTPIDELIDAPCDHPAPCLPPVPAPPIVASEQHPQAPEGASHQEQFTCPYLQHEAARKHCPTTDVTSGADVLTNLGRLEEAQQVFAMAGLLHQGGQTWEAREAWQAVHRLVPGSRFDCEAQEMLAATAATPDATPAAAETAEPPEAGDSVARELNDFMDRLWCTCDRVFSPAMPWFGDASNHCPAEQDKTGPEHQDGRVIESKEQQGSDSTFSFADLWSSPGSLMFGLGVDEGGLVLSGDLRSGGRYLHIVCGRRYFLVWAGAQEPSTNAPGSH